MAIIMTLCLMNIIMSSDVMPILIAERNFFGEPKHFPPRPT